MIQSFNRLMRVDSMPKYKYRLLTYYVAGYTVGPLEMKISVVRLKKEKVTPAPPEVWTLAALKGRWDGP